MRLRLIANLTLQTLIWGVVVSLLLVWTAGRWDWTEGWGLVAMMALPGLGVGVWLAWKDPALLAERLKPPLQAGQKPWDRAFIALLVLGMHGWLLLMALDARRTGWDAIPLWGKGLGVLAIAVGYAGIAWVYAYNSFATTVVKLQDDRGQKVIDSGPYAIVRHPMYAAGVLYLLGPPLILGSVWGLIGVPVAAAMIAARAVAEERVLAAELEGYAAYRARVRHRLIPGVW